MNIASSSEQFPVTLGDIATLTASLDHEELGIAIQLMAYHAQTGSPLPCYGSRRVMGVSTYKIRKISKSLKKVFNTRNGCWVFEPLAERLADPTPEASARKSRLEKPKKTVAPISAAISTGAADLFTPSRRPQQAKPAPSTPEFRSDTLQGADAGTFAQPAPAPKTIHQPIANRSSEKKIHSASQSEAHPTLFEMPPLQQPSDTDADLAKKTQMQDARKVIFENGVELLKGAGITEQTARGQIARLLKKYSDAFVADTIQKAIEKGSLVQPYAWMSACLKEYPTREDQKQKWFNDNFSKPKPNSKHAKQSSVGPRFIGISEGKAKRIQETNQSAAKKFQFN